MTFAVALDFKKKTEQKISLDRVSEACGNGDYCWVDFDAVDEAELRDFLLNLGANQQTIEEIIEFDPVSVFNVYPTCLHFTLSEARMVGREFKTIPVHVLLGDGFLVTIHCEHVEFLRRAQQTYREGFNTAALSPGFLLFELADHLAHVFGVTLASFAEQIERIEEQLFGEMSDKIFVEVSELIRSLLQFRKAVISAREIVHDLATRRSPFVTETTQPYLEKKAALMDRLSADATTEREVLSEFLNLYMGIVGHRTNRVVTRLTVISTIFLPLAFLTGLFGMNFEHMPETKHPLGYVGFWIVSAVLVMSLLLWMRRKKWL